MDNKPKITFCILTRDMIKAYTVMSLRNVGANEKLKEKFSMEEQWAVGKSDLPKARSEQLTRWYTNPETRENDIFMFIDSDQTFLPQDVEKAMNLLQRADVVCGGYARNDGSPTVETINRYELFKNKEAFIQYGSTGFMAISYGITDKIAKEIGLVKSKNYEKCYPFFLERIVQEDYELGDLWLGEDYSFCWLVRQHGGKLMGFLSDTLGHVLSKISLVKQVKFTNWGEKSIVIMASCTPEKWSPASVHRGIGGSELAIIKLAPYWIQAGYKVVVFCNCLEEGLYNGVLYVNYDKFQNQDKFDILILWRNYKLLGSLNFNARKLLFDMHDLDKIDPKLAKKVDVFCMKSKMHAQLCLEGIPEEKISVIPNGGQVENTFEEKRDPYYIIYSSSYDRGLDYMLRWGWPKIKKEVPEAYLKVYYGWNGFDNILDCFSEEVQKERIEWKKDMLELFDQEGVEECGRVSQDFLLREKAKANIHWYMGDFQEIDCISVRESSCLGAIPVVSDYTQVFKEKKYCIRVEGDPHTQEGQEKCADVVIDLLKNREKASKYRAELKVEGETWEDISNRWVKLFE